MTSATVATTTAEAEALSPSALAAKYGTRKLYLSSGNGPVYRTVLNSPLRDARSSEIPVIDVSGIFSASHEDRRRVALDVRSAATNIGFFYIRNHGVEPAVTQAAYGAALDFFRQPLDVKARADAKQSSFFNGYKPPQTQRLNPTESVDVRESFSWQYDPRYDLDVASAGGLDTIPREVMAQLRMEDHQWEQTSNLPHFKTALVDYWRQTLRLARALIRTFALALELDEDFFDAKFSHPDANLLLNYYPPLPDSEQAYSDDDSEINTNGNGSQKEETVSCGAHSDFQVCTILYQDSVGGLQVLNRGGEWIRAVPIEGTLVVNIADYLQRITNDRWASTVHRVQNRSGRERVSIPFFCGFNLNESCGVLDSCVGAGEVKKYEEISCVDWVRKRAKMMHTTEGARNAG
ncbi:gibberellin-44 dioxygenase [Microdochium nivale]|nr:gibberellin-44 dioxygenase [Microdochium nivale]